MKYLKKFENKYIHYEIGDYIVLDIDKIKENNNKNDHTYIPNWKEGKIFKQS